MPFPSSRNVGWLWIEIGRWIDVDRQAYQTQVEMHKVCWGMICIGNRLTYMGDCQFEGKVNNH